VRGPSPGADGGDIPGERTDTIFVMTIDGGRVGLLAFPRDLWVSRCDGTAGRLNTALQLGGPSCLVTTVRQLSGLPIQHHVQITFGGFRDVVDAVGGVEVCLEDAIADADAGIDLPAGCQELSGADALGYVRVRNIDSDLGRIRRQQTFLRALAGEVASPSTLLNPFRLVALTGEVGGAVTVDDRLGPFDLVRLLRGVRGLAGGAAATETVPTTPDTVGGAQVLFLDQAAAGGVFAAFADGSVLADSGAATDAVDPGEVPLRVLNGTGVVGLARQVADLAETRGYPIVEVGNTEPRDTTVIRHPASQAAGARALAADVPGEPTLEESPVPQVTVLLGRDALGR
jgi:LCP family protein required for cell wall assembly